MKELDRWFDLGNAYDRVAHERLAWEIKYKGWSMGTFSKNEGNKNIVENEVRSWIEVRIDVWQDSVFTIVMHINYMNEKLEQGVLWICLLMMQIFRRH